MVKRAEKKSKRNLTGTSLATGSSDHRNEDVDVDNASRLSSPEMDSETVEDPINDQEMDDDDGSDGLNGGLISREARTTTPGIIYLSRVPELMSVKQIRQIFSEFGEIDRIFLQPDGLSPYCGAKIV